MVESFFCACCRNWPEFSGDIQFPVPSFDPDMSAMGAYMAAWDKWNHATDYGKARLRLMRFFIEKLESSLAERDEVGP